MTRGRLWLPTMVLVGPVVWLLHLLVTYGLIYVSCRLSTSLPLHLASLVAIGAVAAALVSGWHVVGPLLASAGSSRPSEAGLSTRRLSVLLGWMLAAYFLVVITMAEVAFLLGGPCE
jgi:hypothetical protein